MGQTEFCRSTTHCSVLTDRLLFNLSSVPYLECEEPRRRVPDDIEYGGLAIYRISYLWYSLLSVGVVLFVGMLVTLLSGPSRWATPPRKLIHKLMWCFVKVESASHEHVLPASGASKKRTPTTAGMVNQAATIEGQTGSVVDLNLNHTSTDSQMTRF